MRVLALVLVCMWPEPYIGRLSEGCNIISTSRSVRDPFFSLVEPGVGVSRVLAWWFLEMAVQSLRQDGDVFG